jgi:hypothetical protein
MLKPGINRARKSNSRRKMQSNDKSVRLLSVPGE